MVFRHLPSEGVDGRGGFLRVSVSTFAGGVGLLGEGNAVAKGSRFTWEGRAVILSFYMFSPSLGSK